MNTIYNYNNIFKLCILILSTSSLLIGCSKDDSKKSKASPYTGYWMIIPTTEEMKKEISPSSGNPQSDIEKFLAYTYEVKPDGIIEKAVIPELEDAIADNQDYLQLQSKTLISEVDHQLSINNNGQLFSKDPDYNCNDYEAKHRDKLNLDEAEDYYLCMAKDPVFLSLILPWVAQPVEGGLSVQVDGTFQQLEGHMETIFNKLKPMTHTDVYTELRHKFYNKYAEEFDERKKERKKKAKFLNDFLSQMIIKRVTKNDIQSYLTKIQNEKNAALASKTKLEQDQSGASAQLDEPPSAPQDNLPAEEDEETTATKLHNSLIVMQNTCYNLSNSDPRHSNCNVTIVDGSIHLDVNTQLKFKSGEATINPDISSTRLFEMIVETSISRLRRFPYPAHVKVQFDGYTDSSGASNKNKEISIARANSAKEYAQRNIINSIHTFLSESNFPAQITEITSAGHGENNLIYLNGTNNEDAERSRRIMLKIIVNLI